MMTYDSDTKHWVDIYTDNNGGYGVQTSPGVQDKTIVWSDAFFTPYNNVVSESPTTEIWPARQEGLIIRPLRNDRVESIPCTPYALKVARAARPDSHSAFVWPAQTVSAHDPTS
jgi:hypothetical protein